MCKYCRFDEEKDIFPKEIVCKDFKLKGKADIKDDYLNGKVAYNRKLRLLSSVFTFEDKKILSYSVFTIDNPKKEDVSVNLEIEINYCPMCGRKLTNEL